MTLKASHTTADSQSQLPAYSQQPQLGNNKSSSVEITKILMKYPFNSSKAEINNIDCNRQHEMPQVQNQHQMMTRKRTLDLNEIEGIKNNKRKI